MQATKIIGIQQWNRSLWSQQKNLKNKFNFGDYVLWFPKGGKSHPGKFTKKWFDLYKVQYVLPNNNMLLVTIEKFETNPILVNIINSNLTNTWNPKCRNNNNKCQCIRNKVYVDFRQRNLIQRWKMKIVTYRNHKYGVMR